MCFGCAQKEYTRQIFAMDTYMELTAYGSNSKEAVDAAVNKINELDRLLSVRNSESEVAKMNSMGKSILSEDTGHILKKSLEVYKMTDGAFNPLIYPVLEEWGFNDKTYKVPDKYSLEKALTRTDISNISFDETTNEAKLINGAKLDFGGIAKGYTSGIVMDIFKGYGIENAIVNLGGNVQVIGKNTDNKPWEIAIRNPDKSKEADYMGVLKVTDRAVVTSGGYERYFEKDGISYHHIIDPASGYPADSGLASVTVVAKDGALADGLSTALFVMGEEKAHELWEQNKEIFDYVLMNNNGEVIITEGLQGSFQY